MKHIRKGFIFTLIIVSVLSVFNIKAQAMGSAPVAENLEISTFRNETVNGILTALDPEDDIAQFVLTTKPIKGEKPCISGNSSYAKRAKWYAIYSCLASTCGCRCVGIVKIISGHECLVYVDDCLPISEEY